MYLRSMTLTGFKSFAERTSLEFGPGVSVVVGPNGSGKSNVTDAVLWVMGEQSPSAVRGHSMQDVIFGGGAGVQPRAAAEVEIVLDNSDGEIDLPLSEISIVRRLERSGEGGYLLNGARCRLADVLELLSDTGLGRESHTVISQGRVGAIVTSKPRDRRLLIEEAAGLGKHRARRRRAQLKLERTQQNLDRALDIEREARSRLRPLRRQSEAAELHERLELQTLQARLELGRDTLRGRRELVAGAERDASAALTQRTEIERELAAVIAERTAAEQTLARRTARMEELSSRTVRARASLERLELRLEQARVSAETVGRRALRLENELAAAADATPAERAPGAERVGELERELAALHAERELELENELADLREQEQSGIAAQERLAAAHAAAQASREEIDSTAEALRADLARAEREAARCRAQAATIGAELAAVNEFLRARSRLAARAGRDSLADRLTIEAGLESALAAALGGRLDALLASDRADAASLIDGSGGEGGRALVLGAAAAAESGEPPNPAARAIGELVDGPDEALAIARALLSGVWLVDRIEDVGADFRGIAVTADGRRWDGRLGELSQNPRGGSEQILARRTERERLIAASQEAARQENSARAACERVSAALVLADERRVESDAELRAAAGRVAEARESLRRTRQTIEQRRDQPGAGPLAVRRAQIEGELAAERRRLESAAAEQAAQQARIERMRLRHARDVELVPRASALCSAIETACAAARSLVSAAEQEVAADRQAGEGAAGELARCAARESQLQAALRECGEHVTRAQVAAQRARDQLADAQAELAGVAERMGLDEIPEPDGPLSEEQGEELRERIERLQRRREKLGPVNPLAKQEYAEAVAYVEELESQREDLEAAMRELRSLIRETDRQIDQRFAETFEGAARNFEQIAGELFPGGSGRLRLVEPEQPMRPVLGGESADREDPGELAAEAEEEHTQEAERELPGVEIEIVPAGKSPRRLSLLSGGEKSMTALAFLFAVFLARPCPFYILDEVEAALDDINLDRFIELLGRHSNSAQFIVITHQKRTMEAADSLYGVSMGRDGVSKVVSRRLPREQPQLADAA